MQAAPRAPSSSGWTQWAGGEEAGRAGEGPTTVWQWLVGRCAEGGPAQGRPSDEATLAAQAALGDILNGVPPGLEQRAGGVDREACQVLAPTRRSAAMA
eukprot:13583924-Alexandrium_andersonii.AAC.1